jgi:transposase
METQSNKIDFSGQHIYAGFDVHLKSWNVTILTEKLKHKTFTQPPSAEVLHNYLVRHFPGGIYHSAYEAGFCGYWIQNKLQALGVDSIVYNAADIPTSNKEKVQKTDKRDSIKIAKALRSGDLKSIYVPSEKTLEDRVLIRTRIMLVRDLSRYKNRIKSFLYFHGIEIPAPFFTTNSHWSKRFYTWLEGIELSEPSGKQALTVIITESKHLRQSILVVTRQIRELANTEAYQNRRLLLQTIPGIGLLTAMIILTELETIDRFQRFDDLCGFIGLVPSTRSSGETERDGNITPRGHSQLRSAIIESSWAAARLDPVLNKSYHEYCKRMESNKAIIRIARKLLSRIRFVLKNNKPYEYSTIN